MLSSIGICIESRSGVVEQEWFVAPIEPEILVFGFCRDVEFEALDATRAEEGFLLEVCAAIEKSGATAIVLCDDAGQTLPEEWSRLIGRVRQTVGVPIYVRMNDALGLAAASSLAAYAAGADGIKVCIDGKETASIERAAQVLFARGEELGFSCAIERTAIPDAPMKRSASFSRIRSPAHRAMLQVTGVSAKLSSESASAGSAGSEASAV